MLLVVAALVAGCQPTPAAVDPADDDRDEVLADLRTHVAAVDEQQAAADQALNGALDTVRLVDEALAQLERPTAFDAALTGYDQVHQAVDATTVDGLREEFFAIAEAVDTARTTLSRARQRLDDPWEVAYLDAQDEVLTTVRSYAETGDRLAQLLIQHWPTYVDVDGRVVDFAARRGNYRDTPEATAALAVEIDTVLGDLIVAESQIAEFRTKRSEAGRAVNDASAAAVEVYQRRSDPPDAG